ILFVFFSSNTSPTYIYTLSLHDALPILGLNFILGITVIFVQPGYIDLIIEMTNIANDHLVLHRFKMLRLNDILIPCSSNNNIGRSEEHTSELQSRENLVCRLLLEKKYKR